MGTLRDIFAKRFSASKSPFDYETCKYEEIEQKSIIHQGYLQYLYNTTILGDSSFRNYLVVLARISMGTMEDMIGLYLFADEKKSSSYFFLINQQTRINDRCQKNIRPLPKFFLMELKFVDKDKVEIFGAKDNSERQTWVEILRNSILKPRLPPAESDSTYLLPVPLVEPSNPLTSVINHADFYPEFDPEYKSIRLNDIYETIHPSARQISSQNDKQRSATPCDEDSSPYSIVEPTDYFRSSGNTAKVNPPFVIENPSEKQSIRSQETKFLWDDIFYTNINDDAKHVLGKTGEFGAFLIRSQSKQTNTSDHLYTLCVYSESNSIRCFPIHQITRRKNGYSLIKNGSPSFDDIISLCQYYTSNPLPTSSNSFYLKKPYKFYEKKISSK